MDRNVDLMDGHTGFPVPQARPALVFARPGPRHSRRLYDKVLVAFHHACDANDIEVGEHLLGLLELIVTRRPRTDEPNRRRTIESLVAAHERLWHLRHPVMD